MKANELRIGNLISANIGSRALDVRSLTAEDICDFSHDKIEIFPILLTERWLKDFGFIKYSDEIITNGVEVMERHLCRLRKLAYNWTFFVRDVGGWFRTLKYVHQLQNLYFALTGNELIFIND